MDLLLAKRRGFLVLPERVSGGGVRVVGRVLRYDPKLPKAERMPLVLAATKKNKRA